MPMKNTVEVIWRQTSNCIKLIASLIQIAHLIQLLLAHKLFAFELKKPPVSQGIYIVFRYFLQRKCSRVFSQKNGNNWNIFFGVGIWKSDISSIIFKKAAWRFKIQFFFCGSSFGFRKGWFDISSSAPPIIATYVSKKIDWKLFKFMNRVDT